jgi:hypothetical protein
LWIKILKKALSTGGKMDQCLKTRGSKDEPAKGGPENGKNNKPDKDRIQRVKKSFLPSWMRETESPKSKLSSPTHPLSV